MPKDAICDQALEVEEIEPMNLVKSAEVEGHWRGGRPSCGLVKQEHCYIPSIQENVRDGANSKSIVTPR